MYDVMIDLETTGTKFHAGILTVGAVKFDIETGAMIDRFYRRFGYDQAALFGSVDPGTLSWWQRQSAEARDQAFNGSDDVFTAAADLSTFCRGATGVWGNGATFDIGILDHWYHVLGGDPAWDFNVCDCRTLERAAKRIGLTRKQCGERTGTHHNALDDAEYQAQYISVMWQRLTNVNDNHVLRARFETMFDRAPYNCDMTRGDNGQYVLPHVQWAWLGFCRGLAV